jgi:hypothetical protein
MEGMTRDSVRALGLLGVLAGLALVACSSAETSVTPADAGRAATADAAAGDPNVLAGTFQVRLVAPIAASGTTAATPGTTSVVGKIYDGAALSEIVWEEAQKDGDCTLLTPRVPFCNTPCGGSAACVENDTCKPYPLAHSAGQVSVSGLAAEGGGTTFTMSPVVNNYQPPAGVTLLYPPFAEGADVRVDAAGDYYRALTLTAKGIAPLLLTSENIPVTTGQPVKITWTPPSQSGSTIIRARLDISHHGGTRGKVECETADSGSLEISAPLVTKLLGLGVAGYPTIIVTRESKGSTTIAPGRVDLLVTSDVERAVTIAGLTSCTETTDCASGQTCQSDLTCK